MTKHRVNFDNKLTAFRITLSVPTPVFASNLTFVYSERLAPMVENRATCEQSAKKNTLSIHFIVFIL